MFQKLYKCLESCYWHLIEERFCFDESIALYEEPGKSEKNNNMFDNMAFYDNVSVIAGRAIVTIDTPTEAKPVTNQPKKLRWQKRPSSEDLSRSVPIIFEEKEDSDESDNKNKSLEPLRKSSSADDVNDSNMSSLKLPPEGSKSTGAVNDAENQIRKKSLRERRASKSMYLKLDIPKELPIIRQNSMPKFYLETPEISQTANQPLTALTSPLTTSSRGFEFDLKSIVQIEKARVHNQSNTPIVPVHRENSKLNMIKKKLRKSKSTLSASNIPPHSNYI